MDLYGGRDGMGNKTTIKRDVQMKKADSTALGRSVGLSVEQEGRHNPHQRRDGKECSATKPQPPSEIKYFLGAILLMGMS